MTPEGRVKKMVKDALKTVPRIWSFMPVQTGYGKRALDFILCVGGWYVVLETKAPGESLTRRQEIIKAEMEAAGALVYVVDGPESLERAMKTIRVLGK